MIRWINVWTWSRNMAGCTIGWSDPNRLDQLPELAKWMLGLITSVWLDGESYSVFFHCRGSSSSHRYRRNTSAWSPGARNICIAWPEYHQSVDVLTIWSHSSQLVYSLLSSRWGMRLKTSLSHESAVQKWRKYLQGLLLYPTNNSLCLFPKLKIHFLSPFAAWNWEQCGMRLCSWFINTCSSDKY